MILASALLASAIPYVARFVCEVADEYRKPASTEMIAVADWQPAAEVTLDRKFFAEYPDHEVHDTWRLGTLFTDGRRVTGIWITEMRGSGSINLTRIKGSEFKYETTVFMAHPPNRIYVGSCKADIRKALPEQSQAIGIKR